MPRSNLRKFFAAATLVILLSGLIPLQARAQTTALAQCAQEIFGIPIPSLTGVININPLSAVPTKDEGAQKTIKQAEQKKCVDRLRDLAVTLARNILKKRILDAIVDQTINWIQGEGSPRFITDFGGFVQDAADVAAGDVIREVGAGDLCQPFRSQLLLQLQEPPPFQQQVTCTLSNVVDNIENFYQDFSQGGWIAYSEAIRPRNNYFGALILGLDEKTVRAARAEEAAKAEAAAGAGFRSERECLEWTATTPEGERVPVSVNASFDYRSPAVGPPTGSYSEFGIEVLSWECTREIVTTPGNVVAGAASQAVELHSNYIINADDLTEYATAIIDAGINRLIREGVGGLRRITTQATTRGFSSEADLPEGLREAGSGYSTESENQRLGQTRDSMVNNLTNALSALEEARTNYQEAKDTFDELIQTSALFKNWCDNTTSGTQNRILHPTTCSNYTDATLSALDTRASSTRAQADAGLEQIDPLINRVSSLIPRVQALNSQNASALTAEATTLLQEVAATTDDAVSLFGNIQAELDAARASLTTCQNPNSPPASCP